MNSLVSPTRPRGRVSSFAPETGGGCRGRRRAGHNGETGEQGQARASRGAGSSPVRPRPPAPPRWRSTPTRSPGRGWRGWSIPGVLRGQTYHHHAALPAPAGPGDRRHPPLQPQVTNPTTNATIDIVNGLKPSLRRLPVPAPGAARAGVHRCRQTTASSRSTRETSAPAPPPVGARIAGPSRVAFLVPGSVLPMPLTTSALFDWLAFTPSVVPSAVIDLSARSRLRPHLRAPKLTETAIEMPWWLQLSPPPQQAWAHSLTPVDHGTPRTELWHTRLGHQEVVNSETRRVRERRPGPHGAWLSGHATRSSPRTSSSPTRPRIPLEQRLAVPGLPHAP